MIDNDKQTNPFSTCIMAGNYEIFEYLVNDVYTKEEIMENINVITRVSKSPLYYACTMAMVEGIGNNNNNGNNSNNDGNTIDV